MAKWFSSLCGENYRPDKRTIYVGNKIPNELDTAVIQERYEYPDNTVVTSHYTIWNFLPKNLFEQFHRIANFYFLCVGLLAIVIDSPVSPWTTFAPLLFVVIVTAIKQGYEDFLRHRADGEVNYQTSKVVRHGALVDIYAKDIEVGDIVYLENNESVPCDIVMLSSDHPEGECSITTANLDGETNLKIFRCAAGTKHLHNIEDFTDFRAVIECQQPIVDLYHFIGRIICYNLTSGVHLENPYSSIDNSSISSQSETASLKRSSSGKVKNGGIASVELDNLTNKRIDSAGLDNNALDLDHEIGPEMQPLAADNVLLRGCMVKNTQYVYGCAIYTGPDTKISLNSRFQNTKFSRVEKRANFFLIIYLIILCIYSGVWTGIYYWYWAKDEAQPEIMWYVRPIDSEEKVSFGKVVGNFFSFMVLYNYIIPISLYVTVELVKIGCKFFFEWDAQMYDPDTNLPAKANTSDLNEELGQVELLFSDKTGTLTENIMEFRECTVGDLQYVDVDGQLCLQAPVVESLPVPVPNMDGALEKLVTVMALCHTVTVEVPKYSLVGQGYIVHAASPDEKALVEACNRYGVVYQGKQGNQIELTYEGERRLYTLHHVLDFDSTRKRMSVIVEDQKGQFIVLTKGADSAIHNYCRTGPVREIEGHIEDYAKRGLRTLCMARRDLTRSTFKKYHVELKKAKSALDNREEKLLHVYTKIEQDLELVGAVAVEDKLQEGVPQTIAALRQAGIQVWVLTGDKEETAVNISHSAGHFEADMVELRLTKSEDLDHCRDTIQELLIIASAEYEGGRRFCLIVDGQSLTYAEHFPDMLRSLCWVVVTVLCCRMTPIQKAKVVQLMKKSDRRPTIAAIGDGANDVSMIQEAHVGIGLFGKEGRQAARCSDYALGKFRFLRRCLLVHGHYFYWRLAILIQYFFYKNVAMISAEMYFTFFSAFSQQSIYAGYYLAFFNMTFAALPILLFGYFEKNLPERMLYHLPWLYKSIRRNEQLSYLELLKWGLLGVWHSLVLFFGWYFAFEPGNAPTSNGQLFGIYDDGGVIMFMCMIVVNIKLMLETYLWNWFILAGFIITFIGFPITTSLIGALIGPALGDWDIYYSMAHYLASPNIWLLTVLVTFSCLLPDIIVRCYNDNFKEMFAPMRHKKALVTPLHRLPSKEESPYSKMIMSDKANGVPSGVQNPNFVTVCDEIAVNRDVVTYM